MPRRFQMMDAQAAMGFVVSQTSHIEPGVNRIVYPDIQYPSLIPVDTSANEWAKTVTYYSADKFGRAEWINGNSDDIPLAGTERSRFETSVYMAAIGYGYGLEEISQANWMGYNLSAEDAMAARRAYEEFVDIVALRGSAPKGFQGLINHSAVTPQAAPNGNWFGASTTEDQILGDLNAAIMQVATDTLYTSIADTIALPGTHIDLIGRTRLSNTTMTLRSFLNQNNSYTLMTGRPLTITQIRGLETAGVGPSNRMIAYRRDPAVLKMHIPMPHRFLPPWQAHALRIEVPGIFRLGGLDIRLPKEVKYFDGI